MLQKATKRRNILACEFNAFKALISSDSEVSKSKMSQAPFTRLLEDDEENELDSINFSTDDNRGLYLSAGAGEPRRRTDYVLVYDTCQENESVDEESAAEAERLKSLRTTFEKNLERQGLILQRKTRVVQKVRQPVYLLCCSTFILA